MLPEWQRIQTLWLEGARDRETCLQLAFLVWYSCAEPPFCTGLPYIENYEQLILEAFNHLGGAACNALEVLFVFRVMSAVAPFCLGDEEYWELIGDLFHQRLAGVVPAVALFDGRGEYGEYFAHQARQLPSE